MYRDFAGLASGPTAVSSGWGPVPADQRVSGQPRKPSYVDMPGGCCLVPPDTHAAWGRFQQAGPVA